MAFAGRLVISQSGWLLLEVPNALVRGAFAAIDLPGVELPPSPTGRLRAHISVMRKEEVEAIGGPDKITEVGKQFGYQLNQLKEVKPSGWAEMDKIWFLVVTSPDLQQLRKSYGLSPKPNKRGESMDFHITVAVRRRGVLANSELSKAADLADTPA